MLGLLALAVLLFFYGAWRGMHHRWPEKPIAMLEQRLHPSPIETGQYGQLIRYPEKVGMPCPQQTARTAVLVVFGQSNSANYQGQRYHALDNRVVNFFDGRCYQAAFPLLGADGVAGESWTLLGNKLVAAGTFDQVVIISTGIGGTDIKRWAKDGDLNRMLIAVIKGLQPVYKPTQLLWHQGESDYMMDKSTKAYKSDFLSMLASLRAEGVDAPIYLSKATYAEFFGGWQPKNPVSEAQASLVDGESILAGPDTDANLGAIDRSDGVHFAGSGQQKFADSYAQILGRVPSRHTAP